MTDNNNEIVPISSSEYNELIKRDRRLAALEAAGVDSWEGYEEAMKILRDWKSDNTAAINEL